MGYALGVDLGTTYTAAATCRDGRTEIATRPRLLVVAALFRPTSTLLSDSVPSFQMSPGDRGGPG